MPLIGNDATTVKTLVLTICLVICVPPFAADKLIEVFRWNQIDFHNKGESQPEPESIVFPDQNIETTRNDSSSYIAYNNVPMGVTHYKGRLFVTVPRRRIGIPSTLNFIDLKKEEGVNASPKLHAYPNFERNYLSPKHEPNTNRIISVYRTSVDECNRLWFIDTGVLEYPDNRNQIQQPSIWIINLNTDELLHRFEIPWSIVETGRGLASITVDITPNQCDQAFAYIPDLVNGELYVYSLKSNTIWAFNHNFFKMDPQQGDFTIGGQSFTWDDGIFSITMGPRQSDGFRTVYFHPMVSTSEFIVSSRVLKNESNSQRSYHGHDFMLLGNRGPMRQSTMHRFDPLTGIIFYAEISRNGVGCWNTQKPFSVDNHGTVDSDAQRMIYPSDLTIDDSGVLWVMTNSMPIFIYSSLDPDVPNFRVWKQNTRTAAQNTVCASNRVDRRPYA